MLVQNNMRFVHICPTNVKLFWNDVSPYIRKSCSYGEDTEDLIYKLVTTSESVLLTIICDDDKLVGAMITEIDNEALHVRQLSINSKKEWIDDFMLICTDITKRLGFTKFTACGRKGWERKLKNYGVVKVDGLYIKEVTL